MKYVYILLQDRPWRIMKINQKMRLNITRALLLLEMPSSLQFEDMGPSRFDDKEVLCFLTLAFLYNYELVQNVDVLNSN